VISEQKTTIDWLRFRTQEEPKRILEAVRALYGTVGDHLKLKSLPRGILGFQQASTINLGDMVLGRMDYGGESQRGWVRVDLPAKGCEWVQDWEYLDCLENLSSCEIRRLDIALTTWDGEVNHDQVVQAHTSGRFTTWGRPPALRQITSSDPMAGRTCYIGAREKSDKFMRCYEKGFEMLSKANVAHLLPSRPDGQPQTGMGIQIDGHPIQGIYRCEVEFKATAKVIPWEVVERRDHYFAGAYPFCADVLPNVEADILMRRPERAPQIDLATALENCRVQFGPTLFTALMAYHGDIGAVWDKVVGRTHNQNLLEAGVLLVDHS
jgi:phage replication initiation protein